MQTNSDGLQPSSDGLQPNSDVPFVELVSPTLTGLRGSLGDCRNPIQYSHVRSGENLKFSSALTSFVKRF